MKYLSLYVFVFSTIAGMISITNNHYVMGSISLVLGLLNYGFYIMNDYRKEEV